MSQSLLYRLHSHDLKPGVQANPEYFKEVYKSTYGRVRIFQVLNIDEESKAWVVDPRNKVCDVQGEWFCRGQYPPALQNVLAEKVDFKPGDKPYQSQYLDNIDKQVHHISLERAAKDEESELRIPSLLGSLDYYGKIEGKEPTDAEVKEFSSIWEDTIYTTEMWTLITKGDVEDLEKWLTVAPLVAHMRSSDGRGPMFWAFEHRRQDMGQMLTKFGVGHSDRDKDGLTPVDLLDSQHVK